MKSYQLTVSTPLGEAYQGEVCGLSLRSIDGDLAILAGHAPILARILPGTLEITLADGQKIEAETDGGLLTVSDSDGVILLCGKMIKKNPLSSPKG
jgi:F-type H+-transporting ATPase subunit epsilon